MSSDGDEGKFRYKKEKTEVASRRVSVRMLSGKIYGPYRRAEILGFISSRKIRGEEEILFEGSAEWQAIASDPEFFDALHALLEGKKAPIHSEAVRNEGSGTGDGATSVKSPLGDDFVVGKTEISAGGIVQSDDPGEGGTRATEIGGIENDELPVEEAKVLSSPKKTKKAGRASDPALSGGWTPDHAVRPQSSPSSSVKTKAKTARAKVKLPGIGALVVTAVLAFAIIWIRDGGGKNPEVAHKSSVVPLKYFEALSEALESWTSRAIPSMPGQIIADVMPVRVGGNASMWAESLQKSLSPLAPAENKINKSYWIQLAWDLAALGATVQVQSIGDAKLYLEQSTAILSELKRKTLLSESDVTLFSALEMFRVSDLEAAAQLAEKLPDDAARWIFENCSWILYWEKKQKKPYFGSSRAFAEAVIDQESRVRRSYAMRDPEINDSMEVLAEQNPFSELLWFASGEVLWRGQGGTGVAVAGQSFVAGLQVLSLAPPAIQVNFWREYVEFLKAYGRKTSLDAGTHNLEMLAQGGIATPDKAKSWWDLGSEGVDPKVYSEGLIKKAKSAELGPGELAALKVFGRLLSNGSEMLAVVATDLILREKYEAADKVIDQMLRRNSNDSEALGLKVWVASIQFKFFDAMSILERDLSKAPQLAQKYRIALLVIGREFEEASASIDNLIQARPQDSWPHYWKAKMKLAQGEPKACMAAANLARLQSRGPLGRSAEILYFQCQIQGKYSLEKAVAEIQANMAKQRSELRYLPLIADAYLGLELPQNALQYLEKALEHYSASGELLLALGKVFENLKQKEKAIAAYQSIAQRIPGDGRGLLELARMLEESGKPIEAARTYQSAAIVNPRMPEVFLRAARALDKAGLPQDAAKMYGREIELRPAVLATFVEAATFLLKNNNPKLVPELYRKFAGGGFEQDPRALLRLAQAYFAMGDFENARISSANAMNVDPKNPEIYLILAQSLEKLGEFPTARSYFQRYLALNPGASDAEEIQERISHPPFSAD